jgi:GR25 family glycosyltransferase involved in LPS biosynthesis
MTLSVQIVVISGNQERQTTMLKQFAELNIPFPVYFLPATLPKNVGSYIDISGLSDYHIRTSCCEKSHIRALEYASRDTSPDVTIIMEDDAAFHKTKFTEVVLELLANWSSIVPSDSHMLSLGWTPFSNYSHYIFAEGYSQLKCLPNSKLLTCFAVGMEVYMVKKESIKQFLPILVQSTHSEVVNAVRSYNCPYLPKEEEILHVDRWLNKLLVQTLVFPLVAIEYKSPSLIQNKIDASETYWDNFFKNYEDERKNYWSYD